MKIQCRVLNVWKRTSRSERRLVRSRAKNCCDAHLRNHCKVTLSLVGGKGARAIAKIGPCSTSQVYRVAERFVEHGPAGLADQREVNEYTKADEYYQAVVLEVVDGSSPAKVWPIVPTPRLDAGTVGVGPGEKKTGIRVSCTTMCRVLNRLKIHVGHPIPIVGCPWKKARRMRRIRDLQRIVDSVPRTRTSCGTRRRDRGARSVGRQLWQRFPTNCEKPDWSDGG